MSIDFKHFRTRLLAERRRLREQAGQAEAGAHEFEREPDMGDASATSEKALRLAVSAELRAKLEEVDHALEKIGLGTYGRCDGCGQDIPRERLEILPEAGLCVVCKSKIR